MRSAKRVGETKTPMASRIEVLSSAGDLEDLRERNVRRVLLAGTAVFSSLEEPTHQGFVPQRQREAAGGLFASLQKESPKVLVSVDERLFDAPKLRVALAIDSYLDWGLKSRDKEGTVLFGGAESADGTNVEIMVFVNRRLVELQEKMLPPPQSHVFRDTLTSTIEEIRVRYPNARLVQAGPLSDWGEPQIEYIGETPFRRLSYRPLVRDVSSRSDYLLPAAIVGAGLLFYVGALTKSWDDFTTAVTQYKEAVSDPAIQKQGGVDTNFLNLMNARRMYMDEPRRQTILAEKAATIVRGVGAVQGVRIVEIKLPAPSIGAQAQVGVAVTPDAQKQRQRIAPDRAPDVWLSISVPNSGDNAMNQAKEVMTRIAGNTGMSVRLAHQGWRDDQAARVFQLEGFIHD